jgi:hypothetical protein
MMVRSIRFSLLFLLGCLASWDARTAWAETSGAAGTWRGTSTCTIAAGACHNESVVYYVRDVKDQADVVFIQADKIVAGKAITMGSAQWKYNRALQTLEWSTAKQVWLLRINGTRMAGTLTLADGTVYRNLTLEKEQ